VVHGRDQRGQDGDGRRFRRPGAFIDNLLVRIHFIIVMIKWTGLVPWEFEFPFPGSLISTFLGPGVFSVSDFGFQENLVIRVSDFRRAKPETLNAQTSPKEGVFFIDNLLVRVHFIIVMIRWTGLAPSEFGFSFPGSLTSTFLWSHAHWDARFLPDPLSRNLKPL